ncbi:MAG: glutathione S-transferase [Marinosulfonomonas sp.]|nr:glutathione S-transferase [Marinosulfonomonas sp.]
MTYDLFIGDRTYSSWSLRGWLMFEKFDIPFNTTMVGLYDGTMKDDLAPLAPATFVPTIRTPEGEPLGDTMAIAETLAERHPDAGLWPSDPAARILARWLAAEMHGGFSALRYDCPMDLSCAYDGFEPSAGVLKDLARIELLWTTAFDRFAGSEPWLFGQYSLADVFYAPVAARIAAFGLPVGPRAQAYVAAHLADPAFRRWRAMGATKKLAKDPYPTGLPKLPWPGQQPLAAKAVENGPSENQECPYSGKPVTHFMELDGRVFGFCNAFCRDKTVHDPLAWPKFSAIYHS